MLDDLKKCCQSSPTMYVPMMYGNVQVDPDAKTSIKCQSCGAKPTAKRAMS